jgi:serine/threonine-protein kinase
VDEIDRESGQLADAILDGDPINWSQAESRVSDHQRRLLDELRLIAAIAAMHRQRSGLPCWGRLRLLERLGAGTFGTVFRAWDPRLQREVAIKMLPVPAADEDSAEAVIHEGRLLARVRHPGIVMIHDAEQIGNVVGLCMELVPGRTLDARIEQDGPLTSAETVEVGLALCGALSAVHEAGLLHRDVKASNVMLADQGRIVLMDFGSAREIEDVGPREYRSGTPLYLAPEVLEGSAASVRSDLYSLGVLLHKALTGSYPVNGRSLLELRIAHNRRLVDDSYTVNQVRPEIPLGLARVIDRAIDARPDRRFESTAAMARPLFALQRRSRNSSISKQPLCNLPSAIGEPERQLVRIWNHESHLRSA